MGFVLVQQGQRKDFKDQELKDMQAEATTFKELALLTDKGVTLAGIENVNGVDAYAVKSGKSTYFYDVKTGFKVAEAKELEQGGQKMTQTTYYQDYKDVKGLKFPYKTNMNVGIEIEYDGRKSSNLSKITEGVRMAIFTGGISPQYYGLGLINFEIK